MEKKYHASERERAFLDGSNQTWQKAMQALTPRPAFASEPLTSEPPLSGDASVEYPESDNSSEPGYSPAERSPPKSVDTQSPVANVATHTRAVTNISQAAELNPSQRKPALKVPTLPAWDNQNGEDNVNIFLPRLAQYLHNQGLSQQELPLNVYPFLKGKAFQLWQLEADSLTQEH